jgi:NAD(P)-dependent dehydrogenase (short-subunit alcohol dehydrogenase family)
MKVMITGANRGIGAALADAYRLAGTDVVATARKAGAGLSRLDVTDPASVRAMAKSFGDGPLDTLVCNAGIYPKGRETLVDGYPPEDWAETFAVNVTGVFLTVQALLPNLRRARGKVAIISSIMGSQARAPGGNLIYRASKAAALNLGRNLAVDLRADGIAVGIYHPGWVRTDMGGADADIDLTTSVDGLVKRFAALGLATTGCFEDYTGRAIAF